MNFNVSSHIVAFMGMLALHVGIAVLALQPQAPMMIPQQQIIQISMVAPTVLKQELSQPKEAFKQQPKLPPQEMGMVKAHPEKNTADPSPKEEKEAHKTTQHQTQLTSGLQAQEATQKHAAITKAVAADYLKNTPPIYPERARRRGQEGVVMLDVRVGVDGKPSAIRIHRSSGVESLDDAALDAVRRWSFVPGRRGSELVESSVLVPIHFRIN